MAKTSFEGLTSEEAERRLAYYGPNALPKPPPKSVLSIILRTLREPMFVLLVGAAVLYLLIGDLGEGLFMVAGAGAAISLVVFQEMRTERALEALRELAEPMAHVLRDGEERRVRARELVPGDIILVGEGERLPADGLLRGGDALIVDESILTGESAPVTKTFVQGPAPEELPNPGGDDTPYLYSGTMIARGSGVAEVVRTGEKTAIGGVGASLASIESAPSPLQRTTAGLIARIGVLALFFCALVSVAYALAHGDWIQGGLAGITLAIGLLPEEFPMVLTIFLAIGAWRLARGNVLVRRSAATETLGSASVLCVDKTGTLTQNRMTAAALFTGGEIFRLSETPAPPAYEELIRVALLASSANPVDPMDRAMHALAKSAGVESAGEPLRTYPIRPERLAFIQLWRIADALVFAAKGAPEAVFTLARLSPEARADYHAAMQDMAARGLRMLAVAKAEAGDSLDIEPGDVEFSLLGLVAFEDPIRAEVPAAVEAARRAGVAVAMITGDYPATALAIAKQAGIDTQAGCLTGDEIAAALPEALSEHIRHVRVFARVTPSHKLAIVEAFKAGGEVVAMTGDGVNDAPALAASHIGVAMGLRGADVAREAADIVLLDDSFASIVAGIKLGRRIFGNLRKAFTFIVAIHVPIAGLALLPILMGLPLLLLPAHVVLMELMIDPICALAFEAEPSEPDAMDKPPRRQGESLMEVSHLMLGVAQGAVILAAVISVYVIALGLSLPEHEARGLAFASLITGNLTLALSDALPRHASPFSREHRSFWIIAVAALSVVLTGLYFPPLAELLRFEPPELEPLLLALALAVFAGGWYGVGRRLAGE
jgi:Ca2+-transporting ATPase